MKKKAQGSTPSSASTSGVDHSLREWWTTVPNARKRELLSVTQSQMAQKLRLECCSGCYSITMQRYKDMCGAGDFHAELVAGNSCWTLRDELVQQPWPAIARSPHARHLAVQRKLSAHGITTDVATCGMGWRKRNGRSGICALHTIRHPTDGLLTHLHTVDSATRATLFTMAEEDFLAELDSQLRHTLRVCTECRSNITRAFRELKTGAAIDTCCDCCDLGDAPHVMTLVPGVAMEAKGGTVALIHSSGVEEDLMCMIEYAQELEDEQLGDGDSDSDGYSDRVRHAETPCAAREALVDGACLVYKQQVERNLTSQLVWYNAQLHLQELALDIMHEGVHNAFKELSAQRATEELLQMLDEEDRGKASKKAKKKKGKKAACRDEEAAAEEARQGKAGGQGGSHAGPNAEANAGQGGSKVGSEDGAEVEDEEAEEEQLEDLSPMQLLEKAMEDQARLERPPTKKDHSKKDQPKKGRPVQPRAVPIPLPSAELPAKPVRAVPIPLPPEPRAPRAVPIPLPEVRQPRASMGPAPRKAVPPPPPPIAAPRVVAVPIDLSKVAKGRAGAAAPVAMAAAVPPPPAAPPMSGSSSFSLFGPYSVNWIDTLGIHGNGQPNGMVGPHGNEPLQVHGSLR